MTIPPADIYLVSSCLMGLCTRYDGKLKASEECRLLLQSAVWIPICPEQLGGLPTPREAADIIGGDGHDVLAGRAKVITKSGEDVSRQFIKGARQVLAIALSQKIHSVILKSHSPSCGASGKSGVTAALLKENGIHLEEF
ncbi:DUF523 domain-containing protein [Desulfopila inferna]|uniref:DUF523 domain-containing protein n=1 Tax=Desulfopila inferna TaxID=468528 RepID=UPI001962B25F|nr:DUF523 domain-containing protein [Desulfopila inferna]MBM9605541.1 DUF523 domain-containing protein [Desulfopila inferna]